VIILNSGITINISKLFLNLIHHFLLCFKIITFISNVHCQSCLMYICMKCHSGGTDPGHLQLDGLTQAMCVSSVWVFVDSRGSSRRPGSTDGRASSMSLYSTRSQPPPLEPTSPGLSCLRCLSQSFFFHCSTVKCGYKELIGTMKISSL